jgi:hypothetical protein
MPGSGVRKRRHAEALRAAKLYAHGWTYRNIAELLGKRDDQIKALIVQYGSTNPTTEWSEAKNPVRYGVSR